ncbi:phage integrase [Erythrobacter sp. SD-21]|nr:tyrosine-type recombinase/integrase [Erythrobacter sp. SD-21]EDL49455.1 phage integrase [Erythrobacter sp. SD-21]
MTALAPHLTAFLREHLPRERAVSPHTVKTYANCFVLLVRFASDRLKRRPTDLEIEDFGTDMIMAFLGHVEVERGSCVRTRNGRLAAIRSFFRYIEYRVPACLDQALRVRSIPSKKANKTLIDYLDRAEIKALLDAPDPRTRLGTRDRAMLHLTYAAGLRVSELVSLQLRDFPDRSLSTVHIMGKGRRERVLPLWKETQSALRAWLVIRPETEVAEVFLNANGQPITRDGFAFRLAKHVNAAAKKQPSFLRDAHARSDRRYSQGRTMAWTCQHPEHRNISARRFRGEAADFGCAWRAGNQPWTLQAAVRHSDRHAQRRPQAGIAFGHAAPTAQLSGVKS